MAGESREGKNERTVKVKTHSKKKVMKPLLELGTAKFSIVAKEIKIDIRINAWL